MYKRQVLSSAGASRTAVRSRRGSYSPLHAHSSPVICAVSSRPAIMPPLSPQPPKPVATYVWCAPGCIGPTIGTVSVGSMSCVAQAWVRSTPGKCSSAQAARVPKRSRVSPVPGVKCSPVTTSRRRPSSRGAVRTERVFSSGVMYMPSTSRSAPMLPATTSSRRGERRAKSRARSKTG